MGKRRAADRSIAARFAPRRLSRMRRMAFVHLRAHTEYSVVDGTLRIDDAVAAAAADGQGALAITDLSNLFGAVKFYSAARRAGVKPIIGAEVCMAAEPGEKATSRLVLLVQNRAGYLNLCELLSRGWLQNAASGHAMIEWSWLAECGEGLIALSGADQGALGRALLAGDDARAVALAERLGAAFPRRFYLEVQRCGLPGNEAHVRAAVELAARARAAGRRDPRGPVPRPRRLRGARGAGLRRRRRDARQSAPRQALQPRAVLQDAGADGGALRRPAERARQLGRDREALQPEPGARQAAAARLRDAARRRRARADGRVFPDRLARRASRRASRGSTPTPRRASASGRATSSGSTSRSRRS